MKKLVVFVSAIILTFGFAGFAGAGLIGRINWTSSMGCAVITSEMNFSVVFDLNETSRIFDSLLVDTSHVGVEYFATSSSGFSPDNGFDKFTEYLTDGSDEALLFWSESGLSSGYGSGMGTWESLWFGTFPDFKGYTVEALGLRINSLTIESPGADPNGDGVWTDSTWNVTLNVYGQQPVPEPTTMLLVGSGLLGMAAFRRKLKK